MPPASPPSPAQTDRTQFYQCFETVDSIPFAGKTVTVSFYARRGANYSATSNNLEYEFRTGTGTDQNPINAYTGSSNVATGNITLTTTWQRFSVGGTLSSSATEMVFNFLVNWTGTAGTNDYIEVTGFQIDVGSVALPYRRNSVTIQGELAACQRYFYSTTRNAEEYLAAGHMKSTTAADFILRFPVPMRVKPTMSAASGTNLFYVDTFSAQSNISTIGSLTNTSVNSTWGRATVSGYTAGQGMLISGNAGGYIEASAEL